MSFAEGTSVSVEKSRAEIEKLLSRYGASKFACGWDGPRVMLGFTAKGRTIRFILTMPDKSDERFRLTPSRKWARSESEALAAWEQECRRGWRALALVIKAKLEAVESGIATFEDEFLAYTVLPGGQTVSEHIQPGIAAAIQSGRLSNAPLLQIGAG